jgi:hypothetical protein
VTFSGAPTGGADVWLGWKKSDGTITDGFTFEPAARRELARCLDAGGVAAAAIPEIEQAVDVFRVQLASPGPTRDTAERLRRLAAASERFMAGLETLDDDGRDLLRETLMQRGAAPCALQALRERHEALERALEVLDRERGKRLAKPGRPREGARTWLLRELHEILTRHHRLSQHNVLEALARHGVSTSARSRNLPLAECARIVLRAVGEPVPAALPRLARKVQKPSRKP